MIALGALLSSACATGRVYNNPDLQLVAHYTAKETCSCLFVLEQPEEFCRAWTRYDPPVASWSVDRAAKRVEASALFEKAHARYANERDGCVIE
jgi:hypothetical protein